MSHNQFKVQGKTANETGEISLSIADVGGFTSTNNKMIGVDANGDVVQADAPQSSGFKWIPTYHYFARAGGYGYGSTNYINTTTHQYLGIRKYSGIRTMDSAYATGMFTTGGSPSVHGTWDNVVRLQAGTYLFNAAYMAEARSGSDLCIVSLKNLTDNTRHGNKCYWGVDKHSSNMYAYVTITTQKLFGFSVETKYGTPYANGIGTLVCLHYNIWRLA